MASSEAGPDLSSANEGDEEIIPRWKWEDHIDPKAKKPKGKLNILSQQIDHLKTSLITAERTCRALESSLTITQEAHDAAVQSYNKLATKKNKLAEEVKGLKNEVCVWKSKVLDEMLEKEVVMRMLEMERGKVGAVEGQLARILVEGGRGEEGGKVEEGRENKVRRERGRKRWRRSDSDSESLSESEHTDGEVSMDGTGTDG